MDSKYNVIGVNAKPSNAAGTNKSTFVTRKIDSNVTYNKLQSNSQPQLKKPKLENKNNNSQPGRFHGQTIEFKSLCEQRKALPIYEVRDRLLSEIKKHSSVIVIGETGSGKTTQIPQFLHEAMLDGNGMIAITQPRRVAAITISDRVAKEMNTQLGHTVGYTVRFDDTTTEHTKLKYLTDGMLLREAMLDNLLLAYSIIILDEAHDRTVNTDILFGIVKQAQITRQARKLKPLKIVVMSATMDVDHFSNYFGNIPILYLEGRQYPVQIYHSAEHQDDYVFSSLVTVFQIHKEAPANQDILVFLTGQEEIDSMASTIRALAKELDPKYPPLKIFSLYSSMPTARQTEVFRPTPSGMRKVILSTNIAETSVTIPGIRFVIDSGMVKVRTHHTGTGLDTLKVQRISQAQAWQRSGRAGRDAAGSCYRVCTKEEFNQLLVNSVPEIQRCNLTSVVLQLMALHINVNTFDFMDAPPKEAILGAIEELVNLGATKTASSNFLLPLGKEMAQFPLDPHYSKILLSAKTYGCVDEIVSIIALLSSESVFSNTQKKREEAILVRQKFCSPTGDHITLLNIYRAYNNIGEKKRQWCSENFLNERSLLYASQVRTQLVEICKRAGIFPCSVGQDLDQVRKCLITGLFANVAQHIRHKHYITVTTRQPVCIHPSSVLFNTMPQYVLFTEVVQTGQCYLRELSVIEAEWLHEIVPDYMRQHRLSSYA